MVATVLYELVLNAVLVRGVCMCVDGGYAYTKELLEFQKRTSPAGRAELPEEARVVRTPLKREAFRELLQEHPDRGFREYILEGLEHGFRVGFGYSMVSCKCAKRNMVSAEEHPEVVERYLAKERRLGRVIGPLECARFPQVQVSRFGVIPKPHQPGEWRLIVDLSYPTGSSVNDGIEAKLCSLRYPSVDEAVRRLLARDPHSFMAKLDIESAYRIIPVHPDDRPLLGMRWKGKLYIDMALPFGLRSAPKIFNAVADAVEWILVQRGVEVVHYLDDYLIVGPADKGECEAVLGQVCKVFARLGIPIAHHKTEGPARSLVFLGIEIDAAEGILRLPEDKLRRLRSTIAMWHNRRSCTKRELLSVIGQLQHACCVVRPGRSFLRRMIDLSKSVKDMDRSIRLNKGFRSDLQWWALFLPSWNGVGMMAGAVRSRWALVLTSDASGNWGCGAYTSAGKWLQLQWPEAWSRVHITVKELAPIVLAVASWGKEWEGMTVKCRCDNAAVVAILHSGRSKDERVMHLMRALFFFLAKFKITLIGSHIPGVENGAADALSRDNVDLFRQQVPGAADRPATIHPGLVQALILRMPDWTSRSWIELLRSIFHGV